MGPSGDDGGQCGRQLPTQAGAEILVPDPLPLTPEAWAPLAGAVLGEVMKTQGEGQDLQSLKGISGTGRSGHWFLPGVVGGGWQA